MRIVLCGFRGTGKTEVARLLSRLTALPCYDTDAIIEASAGKTIYEIFSTEGEAAFRKREKGVILRLPRDDAIISTGGGAILDSENVALLKRQSTTILLEADEETIEKRIAGSERPPLTRLALKDEIHHLLLERGPYYLGTADFCINTSRKNINEVCLAIQRIIREGQSTRGAKERAVHKIAESGIAPEEVAQLRKRVIDNEPDPTMRIFAVAGNPATHSRSPHLFNQLFSHFQLKCFYTRLQGHNLGTLIRTARDLDIRGISVTIPFKKDILQYIDSPDAHSEAIGAANTVLFCGESTYGFNTDWLGIREPLSDLGGSRAVVLGAGGAAAAAVYALCDLHMEVTILNRTPDHAAHLSQRFGCDYGPFEAFDQIRPDVVVNATPLGMAPDQRSPLRKDQLRSSMTVFDLVYTPPETPLVRYARNSGCQTITGTEMFLRQAGVQFWHFTGIIAQFDLIRKMMQ